MRSYEYLPTFITAIFPKYKCWTPHKDLFYNLVTQNINLFTCFYLLYVKTIQHPDNLSKYMYVINVHNKSLMARIMVNNNAALKIS